MTWSELIKYDSHPERAFCYTEKTKYTHKTNLHLENKRTVTKGDGGEIKKELGISRYKLIQIKLINNEILLYTTGNYI